MGLVVLLILIGVPAFELWLLIEVGGEIGALPTIALIVLTAALGAILFRVQGLATLQRVQENVARNEPPVGEVISGFGLLFAGLLLLIPGFATDALGFILFIPPLRRWLAAAVIASMVARDGTTIFMDLRARQGGPEHGRAGDRSRHGPGDVIDGDYEDISEPDPTPTKNGESKPLTPPKE